MSEYRHDPIFGHCTIVARERGERPGAFAASSQRGIPGTCPFCEGNEAETPPEVWASRPAGSSPNGPGWQLRVVPNKYPALEGRSGRHEVIIESPRHAISLTDFNAAETFLVFQAYRARLLAARADGRYAFAQVFKNVGPAAGASIEHAHSQLVATDRLPPDVAARLQAARRAGAERQACAFCGLLTDELQSGERVVLTSEYAVAICPVASRLPYEVWVLPRAHASRLEELSDASLAGMADAARQVIGRIEAVLDHPAYNILLHSAPLTGNDLDAWHVYMEILPRVTQPAGFEWATGLYINPVPPEHAAATLRATN